MFIPQNHPKSQQRVRTCAVIEKPVFRASLALSMLEIELYQISLPYDRGRSGYEITRELESLRGSHGNSTIDLRHGVIYFSFSRTNCASRNQRQFFLKEVFFQS